MQRLSTDGHIWPVGSIIKNLNVSINRHNNNMAQNANIHEPIANEIDNSIKSMPNGILLNVVLQPKIIQKEMKWENGESHEGYI